MAAPTRESEAQTTDQMAAGIHRLVEQVGETRREIADLRNLVSQGSADIRRELAEKIALEVERRLAERDSRGHALASYSHTGRSQNPLAHAEHDYEVAIETALRDLVALATSNTRLSFRLQKFYLDLFDRSSRQSLDLQRRIYSETLKEIARDILQETTLPTKHRVNPGETLSEISNRYYGDARETNWRKVYDANREVIGGEPHAIRPGDPIREGATLNIPA